jgi:hypothetical protein
MPPTSDAPILLKLAREVAEAEPDRRIIWIDDNLCE